MKTIQRHLSLSFIVVLFLITACKKGTVLNLNPGAGVDLSEQVQTTIIGQLLDEQGQPVAGAQVRVGSKSTQTNARGLYILQAVKGPKNATLITAQKAGYFDGFKTIRIRAGQTNYVHMQLMDKGAAQTLNAAAGGTLQFQGVRLMFQANSFKNKITQQPYSGTVHVYTRWLDPTADNLAKIMPGALRGVGSTGRERALTTYGMLVTELYDDQGNALQLVSGKPAEMHMQVPANVVSQAPVTIPLWHFDEATGLWVEEGQATLQGQEYVGNLAHFSYWNCDFPNDILTVTFTLVDGNGNPLPNFYIDITSPNTPGHCGGSTDANGLAQIDLPPNTVLNMVGYPVGGGCAVPILTFTTGNSNMNLGNIVLNGGNSSAQFSVQGTVVDCNGNSLPNALVELAGFNWYFLLTTDAQGQFNVSTFSCANWPQTAQVTAYDVVSGLNGGSISITVNSGTNNLNVLQACGTQSGFIQWTSTLGGVSSSFSLQEGLHILHMDYSNISNESYVGGSDSVNNKWINFTMDGGQSIGLKNVLTYSDQLEQQCTLMGTPQVNITNFPTAIGGFIEGQMNINVQGPVLGQRVISAQFRVKRW